MVGTPRSVGTFSATPNLFGESWCPTVSTPSAQEAKASRAWIKCSRVHTLADRKRRDELPAIGINHRHHLVVATGKQPPIFVIIAHPIGSPQKPAANATSPLTCCVFKIDENFAFFVPDGEFGLAIQLDCSDHRPLGGIDCRRIMTSAAKGKDPFFSPDRKESRRDTHQP